MDTTTPPSADQPPYPPTGQPPYSAGQPPYPPQAPQPAAPTSGPPRSGSDGFFDAIRRTGLVRAQDRWIGGVASGFALRFGIDPLLVRGILGVTVLFGGAGFILYAFAWALLPEQADGRIHLQETFRGHFDAALLGAIGMFIVGTSTDGWAFGTWNDAGLGWLTGIFWIAAIVTVIALLIAAANRRGTTPPNAGQPGAGTPSTFAAPPPPATYSTPAAPGGYAGHAAPARGGRPGATGPAPTGYAGYPAPSSGYTGYGAPSGYAAPPSGYAARPQPTAPDTYAGIPPKPRKPRVYGPGSAAVGAVVGLTLVALAVLLIAERQEGSLNLSVGLTAAGIGIVLAGLGIIVAGLRGRSSGTLGFLAIVGIVLAVPASAFTQADWTSNSDNAQFIAPDGAWTPTTLTQARGGIAAAVGDLDVDLSELSTRGEAVRVPISLGAGELTVTVPAGAAVTADVRLAAGDISWEVDDPQQISGVTGSRSYDFASDEVTDGASPALILELESGAGQVRVVEVDR